MNDSYHTYAKPSKRFHIYLPLELVDAVDRQAKADFTTRSSLMRDAILEYLRPTDGQTDEHDLYTDPEEVLRMLQRRKLRASLQKILKDRRKA